MRCIDAKPQPCRPCEGASAMRMRSRGLRGVLAQFLTRAIVIGPVRAPGLVAGLGECEGVPPAVHGAVRSWPSRSLVVGGFVRLGGANERRTWKAALAG
jgi:hypothetical protein